MMKKINVFLFDDDKTTITLIEKYLTELTFDYNLIQKNSFDGKLIKNSQGDNIIILNINVSNIDLLEKLPQYTQNKNNHFLIISYTNSTDLNVRAIRNGAKDFVSKPIVKSDFLYRIQKIYQKDIMKQESVKNSIINTVISAEKGEGKTSFIINLAEQLALLSNEKILIIDFNNAINDISMMLNLDIEYNLPWFLNKINEENSEEIFSKALQYKKLPVYIIASGVLGVKKIPQDTFRVQTLLQTAKKHFKYIFVDLDSGLTNIYEFVKKRQSDRIYIVFNPNSASVNATKKLLTLELVLKNPRMILNKYTEKVESKIKDYKEDFKTEFLWTIPTNFLASSGASAKKKTLKEINPKMNIVECYKNLAEIIISRD